MNDVSLINRTITLASKARGLTSPNPMVGAVLVKGGRIIAEDYHRRAGSPHAEALVLEKAGLKARGSALYVSLEPCCHTTKRTPPCTKAITEAGINRVVVAMEDPNPKVSGKGIEELRKAGIEVISGILKEKAARLNEYYIKYITTKKPFVILKAAMTLDGKIATPEGESKWITGEKARREVHKLRASVDAIVTAAGTVKMDNPELTVRLKRTPHRTDKPVRVVIDPDLETPLDARILNTPPDTIFAVRKSADPSKKNALSSRGIRVIEFEGARLDLKLLVSLLGDSGITSVLIEGGSSLNAYALENGIVDKVLFFIAPKIIGGKDSYTAVGGRVFRKLSDAYRLKDLTVRKIGEDFLAEGYL